jgi:ATP-dependent exoDNAse (exonuclease V) beta subunit
MDEPHSVVWWSPSELSLGAQTPLGLRREELIVRDVPLAVLQRYRDEHDSWKVRRASAIEQSRRPSIALATATEAAAQGVATVGEDDEPAVTIDRIQASIERPAGARFGTLVHVLLSDVPLSDPSTRPASLVGSLGSLRASPSRSLLEDLARAHGRILGAGDQEIVAACELVAQALAHPVMQAAARATAAGTCYRETPVTLRLADETLVEGHVDLAFDDGKEFVVVDFKTDRELEGALDRYRRQVQIYALAISKATGRRARGVLMNL